MKIERKRMEIITLGLFFLIFLGAVSATLSPTGVNYEVVALMTIKNALKDPYNVLENWDINAVDPCSWRMITCSTDGYVSSLGLPSQSLSGMLSPAIQNLTKLESVLLQNNAISGSIPPELGKLEMLQTLDLSNNSFTGTIPSSLGDLKILNYLRLNNNSLTGPCPESLSKIESLTLVDLSFNNLSGSLPKISTRTFKIIGNPLICGTSSSSNCSVVSPEPLSFPPDTLRAQSKSGRKNHRAAVAIGVGCSASILTLAVIMLGVWWCYGRRRQIFFDVNGLSSVSSLYSSP